MRGWKECLPIPHPKSSTQLWPEKQETDWEKVRGGVEEKKFKEGRFGGTATPTQTTEPGKGRIWEIGEDERGWGYQQGGEGPPRATPPKAWGGGGAWGTRGKGGWRGARRTGQLAGQPRSGAGSLTCRPLGCLLFPPWHRSTSLQSRFWRPSPEPRAGARGLARLSGSPPPPARRLLGRLSASVPLTIPPATPPPRARDPPLRMADTGGLCRLV